MSLSPNFVYDENMKLHKTIDSLQAEIERLRKELAEEKGDQFRLQQRMSTLEAEIERLRRDESEYEAICEDLKAKEAEIERLKGHVKELIEEKHAEREACAQVADSFRCGICGMDGKIAAAIRARKDES